MIVKRAPEDVAIAAEAGIETRNQVAIACRTTAIRLRREAELVDRPGRAPNTPALIAARIRKAADRGPDDFLERMPRSTELVLEPSTPQTSQRAVCP